MLMLTIFILRILVHEILKDPWRVLDPEKDDDFPPEDKFKDTSRKNLTILASIIIHTVIDHIKQ